MIVSPQSLLLGGTALVLMWPVTRAIAGARWVSRSPRLALTLWASCGLLIALCLPATLWSLRSADRRQRAVRTVTGGHGFAIPSLAHQVPWRGLCAVVGATVLVLWMTWRLVQTFVSVSLERRRHLEALDLIGLQHPEYDVLVVENDHALAYCVPGILHSTIVVTRGCLELTDPRELQAVLAHERAHAQGRHDLLLTAFIAWQRTFPFLRSTGTAVSAVSALTEMLADDVATREVGAASTISAICRLHSGLPGACDPYGWSPDPPTLRRVRRLLARLPDSQPPPTSSSP